MRLFVFSKCCYKQLTHAVLWRPRSLTSTDRLLSQLNANCADSFITSPKDDSEKQSGETFFSRNWQLDYFIICVEKLQSQRKFSFISRPTSPWNYSSYQALRSESMFPSPTHPGIIQPTKLPSQRQFFFSSHPRGFHKHDLPAHCRPS